MLCRVSLAYVHCQHFVSYQVQEVLYFGTKSRTMTLETGVGVIHYYVCQHKEQLKSLRFPSGVGRE